MARKPKKQKTTIHTIRKAMTADNSPSWEGSEEWTDAELKMKFYEAMQYYSLQIPQKEIKSVIIKWMNLNEFQPEIIAAFRKVKDWRCNSTMANVASCIMRGMPTDREGVLTTNNIVDWLTTRIHDVINDSKEDIIEDDSEQIKKVVSKIDKNEEIINNIVSELDGIIDELYKNMESFDPKTLKYESVLRSYNVKAVHIPAIKEAYANTIAELEIVLGNEVDEQLKEAYNRYSKKALRKLLNSYNDLMGACDLIVQESEVTKKPRIKKPISKEKMVEKLKFKQNDDRLGIKSIDPTSIIGAQELYLYDTKTRKLYRFVGKDGGLSVAGTSIDNYDDTKSIGKMLLKPSEQLTRFKNSGKIALKTFIDEIDTLDIKASGKLTEHQILLKAI